MKMLCLAFFAFCANTNCLTKMPAQITPISMQTASSQQRAPGRCEFNVAVLGGLADKTAPNELIIVIARLGNGEGRRYLNRRRLHNVHTFLTKYIPAEGGQRRPEEVILAEGERIKGYGQIELYSGGKLFYVLSVPRSDDLLLGPCVPDDPTKGVCAQKSARDFYPCRDKYLKRQ